MELTSDFTSKNWITPIHKTLIENGYIYGGETCGCNGTPKKRHYIKNDVDLKVNINNRSYIAKTPQATYNEHISKIYQDPTIFPINTEQ